MLNFNLLGIAALATPFVLASPIMTGSLSPEHEAIARDAIERYKRQSVDQCNPQYMQAGQSVSDCPHKFALDPNGNCVSGIPTTPDGNDNCLGYCEVRLTFNYGQEIPFNNTWCEDNTACQLNVGESIANTYTIEFNFGISGDIDPDDSSLKAGFNLGASYSFSQTITHTTSELFPKPSGETRAGYWTFVPWMIESCGTLTTANAVADVGGFCHGMGCPGDPSVSQCDKNVVYSTGNWCNTTPVPNGDKGQLGSIIFVATDDGNPDRNACPTGQDAIYYFPGVSADPSFQGDASTARSASGKGTGN